MGLKTLAGTLAANAGASGLVEWSAGNTLTAAQLNANAQDCQAPALYGMTPGVLAGGVCTASALVVTVPSGTYYLARSVWWADGAVTISVTDDATSYVWGCSDGELRTTSNTTPPMGYTTRTACILCKAVAAAGTATVDLSAQQVARLGLSAGLSLGYSAIGGAQADADVTLTPMQCVAGSLRIGWTGWTGQHSVIVPSITGAAWYIINALAVTITVKAASGTGVDIATGKTALVQYDGANVRRLTPDV